MPPAFMKAIRAPWLREAASTASAIRSPSADSPASLALRPIERAATLASGRASASRLRARVRSRKALTR